ncbi:MAG: gliding motility-associated C-terminal domain-containing protein [Bacteroidales bacterium]|nr:gliding motility-associated C-terminal domain-containing protein [Bacteroidales bacterium]
MKKLLLVLLFCLSFFTSKAQINLILDPSLEDHYYIYNPLFSPYCDSSDFFPKYWASPNSGSPDYYHIHSNCYFPWWPYTCCIPNNFRGHQVPKEGNGYYFLATINYYEAYDTTRQEESIIGELSQPLMANKTYCLSFYLNQAEQFDLLIDQIGVFFSNTNYYTPFSTIDSIPQLVIHFGKFFKDTTNWVLFTGKYTASGGEKYITFGTFEAQKPYSFDHLYPPDSCTYPPCAQNESGIFIDMVSLYDCTGFYYEAEAGENRELCKGEETTLGWDENTARTFKWSVVSGDSTSLSNDSLPRPTVSPQQTTVYALYVVDEYVQEHFDTVTVEVIDCENPVFVPNIFSPNGDGQNDVLYVRSTYIKELKNFRVFNRWGEEIFQCRTSTGLSMTLEECGWDGTYHGEDAPVGVYAYYVEAVLLNGETVVKRGNVTLVR